MSKKTSTKTTNTAKPTKKAAKIKPAPEASTGECPKGGAHEWTEPKGAKAKREKGTKKAAKPAKEKKVSALDATAQVLQANRDPMNTKDIEQDWERGLGQRLRKCGPGSQAADRRTRERVDHCVPAIISYRWLEGI